MQTQATHILDLRGCKSIPKESPLFDQTLDIARSTVDGWWDVVETDMEEEFIHRLCEYYQTDDTFNFHQERLPPGARIIERRTTDMSGPTVEQVIAAYVKTRNEIKQMEDELAEKVAGLKQFQVNRETWLAQNMANEGVTSKKTGQGTCFFQTSESVTVADWDAVWNYIVQNNKYEYLTHGVNKTAVLEDMGEKRENPLPPGVNYSAIRKVMVRKANEK